MKDDFSKFNKEIDKLIKPALEIQDKISKPYIEMQKSIKPSIDIVQSTQKIFENLNKAALELNKLESKLFKEINFKAIAEKLALYTKDISKHLIIIAQNGWYLELDCELKLPYKLDVMISNGEIKEVDELLIKMYKNKINQIFNELNKRHPNRAEIFNEILKAYKFNLHGLVIPTVLTQIDGICLDFTSEKFFDKKRVNNYIPQVTLFLEKNLDGFIQIYLSAFYNNTPILSHEDDLKKFPCKLNRHKILHGNIHDYNQEINSLKVISLLKYFSDILVRIKSK